MITGNVNIQLYAAGLVIEGLRKYERHAPNGVMAFIRSVRVFDNAESLICSYIPYFSPLSENPTQQLPSHGDSRGPH